MSFVKFFWRDFRSDRSFNYFFLLCATLGIVGLLLVEAFKGGVEDKISKNAKNFIASDLLITSRRVLENNELDAVEKYLAKNNFEFARWIETYSLVSKDNSQDPIAKLANLNFVSKEFPYYGGVVLENIGEKNRGQWSSLHAEPKIWVSRDLAWAQDIKVGDSLKVGLTKFMVEGVIIDDKFSSFRGFSLAPKIFLSYNFLKETDLIKFGSTATFSYAIKLPVQNDLKKIQQDLRRLLPDKSIKIMSPEESSNQISRSLNILADYLSLITLMTYLLSLVGLYYFTQHFLSKKLKIFSIYKSLGINNFFLFKINFFHLIVLTFLALSFSSTLVVLSLVPMQKFFSHLVGEQILFSLHFKSLVRILFLSVGGSLMALGPLYWGALQTPIATLFQDLPAELKRIKFYYFAPLLIYIIALTIFLANSYRVGGYFLGALFVILLVSAIIFKLITYLLEKFSADFTFINRHAALTIARYFTSSFTIFICLLIGMTFTTFIFQLESSLRQEFTDNTGNKRPDLFMFDLQDKDADQFLKVVANEKWSSSLFAPMIRGRLVKINQELLQKKASPNEGEFSTREDQNSEQLRNRGVNLSYRGNLSWSEKIVAGKFNGTICHPEIALCEISLEKYYAERLGVKLGDKLSFDISGMEIIGIVTSFRTVKWVSFEPNFFILFQPGILEDAPKTYLSSFKVKSESEKRAIFTKIANIFPNVSILDVSELVKKMTVIFDLMATAIKFISILSLFVAFVVLIAVSFNHLELRKKDMTLFYMMGLKENIIKKVYEREFIFLIFFCLLFSLVFGSLLTILLMHFIFQTEVIFRFPFVFSMMFFLGI